jgi:hypothetical protein
MSVIWLMARVRAGRIPMLPSGALSSGQARVCVVIESSSETAQSFETSGCHTVGDEALNTRRVAPRGENREFQSCTS